MTYEDKVLKLEQGLRWPAPVWNQPDRQATLADHMSLLGVPGVSAAVIENGEIAWAKGWGVKEAGTSEPVTPETLFQACSISKPVAALGALRLVQQGLLDLDADVNRYLKSFKLQSGEGWAPMVTLRQLLSHTAGTTQHGFPGYNRKAYIPTLDEVLQGGGQVNTGRVMVNAIPGLTQRYSGGGTSVVQKVMEDVTGKPFAALMQELVFEPLGLKHSTYAQPLPEDLWAKAASGHRSGGGVVEGKWHVYPEQAAAGLWTTPSDLLRIALTIQQIRMGNGGGFLSKALVDELLTPARNSTFGIGFDLEEQGALLRFSHGGDNAGFKCYLVAYAEQGLGAAVMTNGDMGYEIMQEMLYAISFEYDWPRSKSYRWLSRPVPDADLPVDESLAEQVAGRYELGGMSAAVRYEHGRLWLDLPTQAPVALQQVRERHFLAQALQVKLTFEEGGSLLLEQPGGSVRAKRE